MSNQKVYVQQKYLKRVITGQKRNDRIKHTVLTQIRQTIRKKKQIRDGKIRKQTAKW